MSWENDEASYIAEMSRQPGARQPATITEVWNSEWQRTALDTAGGLGGLYADARGQLVSAIETASGQGISDYATSKGVKLGSFLTTSQDYEALAALADTLPEEQRKTIEPLKDIRLNAAKRAQKIEADAAGVGDATYGLTAHAVAFMSGIARQSVDPANLIAMAVTAPLGGRGASLLSFIGREAGANAAAQAMVEPVVQPMRADLGLEAGFGRAAGNIVEAGIGGAIIGGGLHLAGRGMRAMRGERPAEPTSAPAPREGTIALPEPAARVSPPEAAPAQPLAPPRPIEQFAPDDFHAAGDLADRDLVIDMMSPDATAAGRFDHAAKVDEAAERIDQPEMSTAQTTIYRGSPLPDVGVVPANLARDGTIHVGRKNGQHFEIELPADIREGLKPGEYGWKDTGFVNPQGEFLTREQALKWVTANEKKVTPSDNMGGELDALDYRDQVPVSRRSAGKSIDPADVVTQELKPNKPRGRAAADPETFSLNEFIASQGGLKPDPELAAIYGTKGGPFVPGFGKLIRNGGKTLDEALTAAKEAGYLTDARDLDGPGNGTLGIAGRRDMGLTPNDLLDRLDAENRGQKSYRPGRERQAVIDDGQEAHAIIGALEKELYETSGGDIRVDQVIADRVVQIVRKEKETDLLSAYERAIMEDAERYEGLAAARASDAELSKIEGWDAHDAGAAPRDGAPDPGQRRQAERAGQGDGGTDGAAPRDAGAGSGTSGKLGDPALAADAARAIEDAGGDLDITLINPDGTTRTLKASDALREVEEDAAAADALNACIIGSAGEIPF